MRDVFLYCAEAMLVVGVGHLAWLLLFFIIGLGAAFCGIKTGPNGLFGRRVRGSTEHLRSGSGDDPKSEEEDKGPRYKW